MGEGSAPASAPQGGGGPGPGGTDPGSTGAGNTGPGGGGGSDVAVDNDIWHESAGCPNCGVIWGQSQNFVYWTIETQVEAAALGGVLKWGGEALSALPKMRVAIGPGEAPSFFHVAYQVGGRYLNAVGDFGNMTVESGVEARATFINSYMKFSVPIRNVGAAMATEGRAASTCVGAWLYALSKGWLP